jgi:hypothetical protein
MTPEPRKPVPLTRILKVLFAGAGWVWGASNRAEKLQEKLTDVTGAHRLPCWTERIEAGDPQPPHRE